MQSVFITGTDTGVGKTLVSCVLLRQLMAQGHRVVGMKPVASGGFLHGGKLRNDDALQLSTTANVDAPYEWINPYCFEPPIAPHIAAHRAGQAISLETIKAAFHQLMHRADVVVVEGVGGWAVPINGAQTMADVAVSLDLPVVMVVGMRLGCLNHALLTAHAIAACSLKLVGWVANTLDANMEAVAENIDTLKNKLSAPLLGVIPQLSQVETSEVKLDIPSI